LSLFRAAVLCAAFTLGALLWSAEAKADLTGFTRGHGSVQLGPRFATDDVNFGLGLNGGYTLEPGVYLGALFDYYLGESESRPLGIEYGFDVWFLMADVGYDFGVGDSLVLRPSISLGITGLHQSCEVPVGSPASYCSDDTELEFVGAGGVNAFYALGRLTLGGEFRIFTGKFDGVWFGLNVGTFF
jgi:hypothetical protein